MILYEWFIEILHTFYLPECLRYFDIYFYTFWSNLLKSYDKIFDIFRRSDISAFSFDRRTKDNRENGREGGGISLDDLFERYDELQRQELGEKTEEGQELRAMIRGYIEQEGLSVRVTRSTSNRELLDLIESEMEGPKPSDEPEDVPGEEEEQPEETEERAGRPRHRR